MARPKFNFEKRQKELARKKKKEQKRLLKQARKNADSTDHSAEPADASDSPEPSVLPSSTVGNLRRTP